METKTNFSKGLLEKDFSVNNSLNVTKDMKMSLEAIDVFQVFILSMFLVFGLVGNTLIISVVAIRTEMRTRTNLFFANLAIAGVGSSLTSVPFMIMGLTRNPRWLWGDTLSKVNCFMWQFWFNECVFTIVALSSYKYISVLKPLTRVMHRKRTHLVIVLTWILAFVLATCPLLGWRKISFRPQASISFYNKPTEMLHISHVIFMSCITYVLPVISVIIIYCRVFSVINKHKSRIRHTRIIDDIGVRAKQRLVITICIVLGLFFLCWMPMFFYGAISPFEVRLPSDFLRATFYCGFAFNAMTSVVLTIRNPRFKRGFCRILTFRSLRKGPQIDLGVSFSSTLSYTNPATDFQEERRGSIWYMSTQKNLLSLEQVPPQRRLKLRWIETNL